MTRQELQRRPGTRRLAVTAVFAVLAATAPASPLPADPPRVTRFALENGLRVVVLHVEGSDDVAVFSFLPLGLVVDGAGKTQWSHLVEHLTLRTTGPITDYRERNAETYYDHTRLDFIGSAADWEKGLDLHARWLSGAPFSEEALAEERPKARSEAGTTVRRLFTHKWAAAAWNQVFRHGKKEVSVLGALEAATLEEIEAYRDDHLVDPGRTVLSIVGGVPPEKLRPAVTARFGKIRPRSKGLPRATSRPPAGRDASARWDLDASHYIEAFRIPEAGRGGHAELRVAAALLQGRLAGDRKLKDSTGAVLSGVDFVTPEATWFYVSASLKPGASGKTVGVVRERIRHHIDAVARGAGDARVAVLARSLASRLRRPADPDAALRFKAANVTGAMVTANIGLQWALLEFRYGKGLRRLADATSRVTGAGLRSAVGTFLAEAKRYTLLLEPAE